MFEEIGWFILILGISFLFQRLMAIHHIRWLHTVVGILGVLGLIIHEASHYIFCKVSGVPVEQVRIKIVKSEKKFTNEGDVITPHWYHETFIQAFIISLAPLFISTILIYYSVLLLLSMSLYLIIIILLSFLIISAFIGAAPSFNDFKAIGKAFNKNPRFSIYQISLLIISFVIVFVVFSFFITIRFYPLLYYFFVVGAYFLLRFIFLIVPKYAKNILS